MKILIVTKNWLGDVIFQTPAIEAIRAHDPDAEIVCLTPARCAPVLAAHPAVNRVIIFDERAEHRGWFSRLRFVFRLRREAFEKAFLFHRSKTRAFLLFLAGVKERIGFDTKGSWFLTQAIPEPKQRMHQADYFLEFLRQAGLPAPKKGVYHFYFSPREGGCAKALLAKYNLENFICFHLGANWEPKRWPAAYFAKLADGIFNRSQLPVVLTGSGKDAALAEEMNQEVRHAQVISLIGETKPGELAAIFKQAQFVVSGDSGPMHIASGVGAKVVALFGPTDPALTGPRGPGETILLQFVPEGYTVPWYGKDLPAEGWLSRIRPGEVLEAIEKRGWLPDHGAARLRDQSLKDPSEKSSPEKKSNAVLLVTLSNIGDVILTTPVITALNARFPNLRLTVVVGPRAKEILEGSRLIHRLIVYDKKAGLSEKFKFLRELRREGYDCVVDLKNSAIPFLVKTNKRSPVIRRFKEISLRRRHLEILKMMGLDTASKGLFDFFNESDEAGLVEKLKTRGIFGERGCGERGCGERGWILIAPVAASGLKAWRLSGFAEVIQRLLQERQEDILLVGSKRERLFMEPLAGLAPSRVYNLAGQTTLRELAALLSRCSLLLCNDSSPMHLGGELNVPVVAIFGPTDAEKFKREGSLFRVVREPVFCSPCDQPVCRFERQACLEDLSAEKVFRACKDLLDSTAAVHS